MSTIADLIAGNTGGSSLAIAIPTYRSITANEQALATKWQAGNASVKADLAHFRKQAATLTSADALLKDRRSLSVVLSSFNMSADIAYPGLLRKLMTEDPSSASSTAQRIGNANYLRFAKAINQFKGNPLGNAETVASVANAHLINSYEAAQGEKVPGMQNALAFKRGAAQVTSIAQVIGNPALLKVAVVQTGIDYTTFGLMDYDRQVALLAKKVKLADFQDAAKVDRMAQQYLVAAGMAPEKWGASASTGFTMLSLFGGGGKTSVLSLFA